MNTPTTSVVVDADNNNHNNEWRLQHLGLVSYPSFKGVTVALFAVACFTVAARILSRMYLRRRLYLDDYFILFGLACLSAATGLVWYFARDTYVYTALTTDPTIRLTGEDIVRVINSVPLLDAFVALACTAIFAVKFSFLALFKSLIRRLSRRITLYYWIVVVFTALAWMFAVGSTFIICPTPSSCVPEIPGPVGIAVGSTSGGLDVIADIMIVSIPVLILQKTQMRFSQKCGLALVLYLSVFMALAAIVRMAGYHRHGKLDVTWLIFWLYFEACLAVIMGSITAFRAVFVQGGFKKASIPKEKLSLYSLHRRVLRKAKSPRYGWEQESDDEHLPKPPSATLAGIRTFVHHNGRHSTENTAQSVDRDGDVLLSQMDSKYVPPPR